MLNSTYIALIPLLPIITFLIIGLVGRRYFPKFSGVLGTLSLLVSFLLSAFVAYQYFFEVGKVEGVYQKIIALKYVWLQFSPNVAIDMGILLDPISVMMIVIVTFISLMVHIYSMGYMNGEPRYATYYAFLSLFTFSMLGLVLSTNIFQIYIFWELVGVSSFLLIGFYYEKPSAVAASKKAFIVTRFADLGFLIGILVLSYYSETLDFQTLIQRLTTEGNYLTSIVSASFLGFSALTWGLVLVFAGGAGKSAMFPFHIWLPDAMEGPTPVSALIHAATMVVAGVYLVARLFPIFSNSCPGALEVVAYIGIFSSLLAAIIACTQTDIKRVLAYSTMSQIGFMMFALGVSGFYAEEGVGFMGSMFHLFTHSIFKALLFLGAGAVIHYVHSNDMKDMGGLRKLMPITHLTFLLACLAIAGIPPFAGFFSKEEILLACWNSNKLIFGAAVLTAGLTAFYMFRLYFNIFWNKEYKSHSESHDAHHGEAPGTMLLPLIILAILSVVAGFVPFSHLVTADGIGFETEFHIGFAIGPVLLAVAAILLAYFMYVKESLVPQKFADTVKGFYTAAYHKFYFDEMYLFITKKIVFNLIGRPAAWIDKTIFDGFMNLIASVTESVSESIKSFQSGKVQDYAIYFFAGTLGFVLLFIYLWT
ncbi:MAG: NADH dehydrogenase [Bacteroidetes bacterium RIFCSPLOWO2_12_FULL_35_15]|nr:MAG: NADH dehydrogenase [Bacteroidetes bacterium RIFCSPLOWO2_12_FULL_35_15]